MRLTYAGVTLSQTETSLLCLIANEETTEIDHDEINVEAESENAPPVFIHRIAWHTSIRAGRERHDNMYFVRHTLYPEIELRFAVLTMKRSPVSDERATEWRYERKRRTDFITIR